MSNPISAKQIPDAPAVIIAGAYQTGVLAVRNLIRRGVKAEYFDCDPSMPGFHSAHRKAMLCPDPDVSPDAWLAFMNGLGKQFGQRPVLVPSADKFITAIARNKEALERHFLLCPAIHIQALLADKTTQYEIAASHGMPMPTTYEVSSLTELESVMGKLRFPCVLKPNHFREWQHFPSAHPLKGAKIALASDPGSLKQQYELAATLTPKLIVQEVIVGSDTDKRIYLACYTAKSTERIGHVVLRELRCDPKQFGPASVTEPVDDPEASGVCDDFLRSIGYAGICEIELKRDERDGKLKLIEVNPRLSGSGDAAPYAGIDLCWLHYLDLIGQSPRPVEPSAQAFRHIVLRADGQTIPAYLAAGLISFRDVIDSYRRPLHFFDVDWGDPRYTIRTLYLYFRNLAWHSIRALLNREHSHEAKH